MARRKFGSRLRALASRVVKNKSISKFVSGASKVMNNPLVKMAGMAVAPRAFAAVDAGLKTAKSVSERVAGFKSLVSGAQAASAARPDRTPQAASSSPAPRETSPRAPTPSPGAQSSQSGRGAALNVDWDAYGETTERLRGVH